MKRVPSAETWERARWRGGGRCPLPGPRGRSHEGQGLGQTGAGRPSCLAHLGRQRRTHRPGHARTARSPTARGPRGWTRSESPSPRNHQESGTRTKCLSKEHDSDLHVLPSSLSVYTAPSCGAKPRGRPTSIRSHSALGAGLTRVTAMSSPAPLVGRDSIWTRGKVWGGSSHCVWDGSAQVVSCLVRGVFAGPRPRSTCTGAGRLPLECQRAGSCLPRLRLLQTSEATRSLGATPSCPAGPHPKDRRTRQDKGGTLEVSGPSAEFLLEKAQLRGHGPMAAGGVRSADGFSFPRRKPGPILCVRRRPRLHGQVRPEGSGAWASAHGPASACSGCRPLGRGPLCATSVLFQCFWNCPVLGSVVKPKHFHPHASVQLQASGRGVRSADAPARAPKAPPEPKSHLPESTGPG